MSICDPRLTYPEKYLKKVMRNMGIEDALQELDKLTQEEARMASAELLRLTHEVNGKVMGVNDKVNGVDERVQGVGADVQNVCRRVQDVDDGVQGIGSDVKDMTNKVQVVEDKIQGIDDKLEQVNRSLSLNFPVLRLEYSDTLTGNQLRDNLLRWLSPPDPSVNHNIACKARHSGTAQWFFRGSVFSHWKSASSLLWIHGKRAFLWSFTI